MKYIFALCVIGTFYLKSAGQNPTNEMAYLLKKAWQTDSCGTLGLRDAAAYYLKESNYLNNKSIDSVVLILGEPYKIYSNKEIAYEYILSCVQDKDYTCLKADPFIVGRLTIFISSKNKRVTDLVIAIE